MREMLIFMETLCQHLIARPDPSIVHVLDFQDHGRHRDGTYIYTYDMERLYPLTKSEKKIIQAAKSDWFYGGRFPSISLFEEVVKGKKEYPDLIDFLEKVMRAGRYTDIHDGNIMIDTVRDYKLIDLEGFYHAPLDHYKNQWFQCEHEVSSSSVNSSAL